ncbi:type II toxin-antitoxin system RelE/ParE family toxin [Polaribacter sp. Q13]|uniref:type II toxin-antitoxin system RelE/ParE family toxin n=1 Tax=Polaribacter sp. Q13 TaxID=2806551 RepID=UPI00193C8595|nr:type II toxin-antitoxin system RelE/ParE family toxin [Polaribacter sp. Q13]QVY66345.1 type II toxin-antitoxin system RelE/ParE family toxin [Polaribacter sp. Q13]
MADYKLSIKAEFDLTVMYEFGISKFGLSQAQNYFLSMHETFKVLSINNDLGRDASEYIREINIFFETNYPRGRAIEVFRWFHFDCRIKNQKICILDSRLHGNDSFNGNLEAEPRGILFD